MFCIPLNSKLYSYSYELLHLAFGLKQSDFLFALHMLSVLFFTVLLRAVFLYFSYGSSYRTSFSYIFVPFAFPFVGPLLAIPTLYTFSGNFFTWLKSQEWSFISICVFFYCVVSFPVWCEGNWSRVHKNPHIGSIKSHSVSSCWAELRIVGEKIIDWW